MKCFFRYSNATVIYPTLQQAMHRLNGAHDTTFKPISDRLSTIMDIFRMHQDGDIGIGLLFASFECSMEYFIRMKFCLQRAAQLET
jgi:hypothetical protein